MSLCRQSGGSKNQYKFIILLKFKSFGKNLHHLHPIFTIISILMFFFSGVEVVF